MAKVTNPTTPLLRRSSFSASASRRPPPSFLAPDDVFKVSPTLGELEDGFRDLAIGLEGLDRNVRELAELTGRINAFNESFASFLYGLKVNSFTSEFLQTPTAHSFHLLPITLERRQKQQASLAATQPSRPQTPAASGEMTMVGTEETFISDQGHMSRDESSIPMRPKSSAVGRSKPKIGKKELGDWIKQVVDTLPLTYREEQTHRSEMEAVLEELRLSNNGVQVASIAKKRKAIPSHRITGCLTTLVQTKHVVKNIDNGLVTFSLNPLKHSL